MPVRSLHSSVLKWPGREQVDRSVRDWAACQVEQRPQVLRIGYFGSYARGDSGVGSDVDLIVVVAHSAEPLIRRGVGWDTLSLPVPADLLVYTAEEWERLREQPFGRGIACEAVWVWTRQQD